MPTPGLVVTLRVNPNDVMSIIDILDHLGVAKANLSFAQATKIVLASFLESARQQGIISTRQGFEYLEMIEPFERQNLSSRAAKLKHAALLNQPNSMDSVPPVIPDSYERRQKKIRMDELMFKFHSDKLNFTKEDHDELGTLISELGPNV